MVKKLVIDICNGGMFDLFDQIHCKYLKKEIINVKQKGQHMPQNFVKYV